MKIKDLREEKIEKALNKKYVAVDVNMSFEDFAQLFIEKEASETSPVFVATEDGEFAGIITSLSVIKPLVPTDKLPKERVIGVRGVDFSYSPKTVADLVTRHPVTGTSEMTFSEAAAIMIKRNITTLPVLDEDNTLLGIITPQSLVTNSK